MSDLKLKRKLPNNRNYDQILNHYNVEKEIAERIKAADRAERKQIYATMYDELFKKVPDHPRLTKRVDDRLTENSIKSKMALMRRFLNPSASFLEFGSGDCRFAMAAANHVKHSYGIDISDQRNPNDLPPDNFDLIVYDGYSIDAINDDYIDLVFSDYLIEHLHPEETLFHFNLVFRLLKYKGKYVFRTPHAFVGPTDISRYFSDVAEGFHLKEWTYADLYAVIKKIGYSKISEYWYAKGIMIKIPFWWMHNLEKIIKLFPREICRKVSRFVLPSIVFAIEK